MQSGVEKIKSMRFTQIAHGPIVKIARVEYSEKNNQRKKGEELKSKGGTEHLATPGNVQDEMNVNSHHDGRYQS